MNSNNNSSALVIIALIIFYVLGKKMKVLMPEQEQEQEQEQDNVQFPHPTIPYYDPTKPDWTPPFHPDYGKPFYDPNSGGDIPINRKPDADVSQSPTGCNIELIERTFDTHNVKFK